ncbi:MAG TPA: ABC transporter permease, partial [bacterium]|nr:ABC transporter permease [bacterium]
MSYRRAAAVARKEFLHIIRDPRSLGMAIGIPVMLLLLFGYALSLDVDRVPTVVWDQSETPASRDYISHFSGSPYFSIKGYARDYREIERAIDSGSALVALVIPSDFAGKVETGNTASVQVIVDGSDSNTATIVLGYVETVAR